ncbi:MAG TPA: hypothetical protein VER55_00790, partial [Ardenticatenaceae bacterium]|nr:hypothetical protein [Ardenticatenaceae bacterium]
MALGQFVLHRFSGDETYRLRSATIRLDSDNGQLRLTFAVSTEEGAIQTQADTASHPTAPNAEVTVLLDTFGKEELVGNGFSIPSGYDENLEEYVAIIYYYEHQELDNNTVEVLNRNGDLFRVRWTGTTRDVNVYD